MHGWEEASQELEKRRKKARAPIMRDSARGETNDELRRPSRSKMSNRKTHSLLAVVEGNWHKNEWPAYSGSSSGVYSFLNHSSIFLLLHSDFRLSLSYNFPSSHFPFLWHSMSSLVHSDIFSPILTPIHSLFI